MFAVVAGVGGLYVNHAKLNGRFDRQDSKLKYMVRSLKVNDKNNTDLKSDVTGLKSEMRMYFLAVLAFSIIEHVSRRR